MAELKKYLDTTALGALVDQIKAEDSKVLQGAKDYANGLATNYDAAGSAAGALTDAKAYTDQLANGQVATNKADIAKLNGNASTEGSVAKAIADAKVVIDGDIDAVEAIANQNKADIATINNADNGILAQAKGYTDAEAAKVQGEVDALETYVGTFTHDTAKTVVEYINAKTDGIATSGNLEALGARVTAVEGDVTTIKANYLDGDDKTELEDKITTAQTAADSAQDYAEGVAGDLATETSERKAADEAQVERIAALEGTIVGLSGAMHFEGVKEALPENTTGYEQGDVIIVGNKEYVANGDKFVEFGDATVNAEAITELTGRVSTAEGKITTAEGKITAVEGAVATKAEKTYVDEQIEALEGVDTGLSNRIATLEGKFGGAEGSVEDMIADAKAEAIATAGTNADTKDATVLTNAKKYTDDEIDRVEATITTLQGVVDGKAAQSEVNTISGKVGTLETDMAQAKTDIDAVEAKAAANETAIGTLNTTVAGKAAQTDLDNAVARIAVNEGAIGTLNTTVADKAEQDDLDAAVERIAANETAIAANTSAINSFTAITADEVNALFA